MVDAGRKQLENLLQQLNEQLLINVSQQSHLSSSPGGAKQIARFVILMHLIKFVCANQNFPRSLSPIHLAP